jgi:Beta-propeller repeat
VRAETPAGEALAKLPLAFEVNRGQSDRRVDFLARGGGYEVFLTRGDSVLALRHGSLLRIGLIGGSRRAPAEPARRLPGRVDYAIGADPRRWRTGIPTYGRVVYRDVYPGIDVAYHGGAQKRLEYDFLVAPGADPRAIGLRLGGIDRFRETQRGDLLLGLGRGTVRLGRPLAYQNWNGFRRRVRAAYEVTGANRLALRVGAYDKTKPLVIDPVLSYSTYLGGSAVDVGWAVAVDAAGNSYVTGETSSSDFPAPGAPHAVAGDDDLFVAKLNATGSALLYTSVLGGGGLDRGFGIGLDATGNAYVVGDTFSNNFPTTAGALQPSSGGDEDAVVAKLDSAGGLVYSTYLGGSGADDGEGIAIGSNGAAYVTGGTESGNFPTTPGGVQTAFAGQVDGFVAELDATGGSLVVSSYLGGSGVDSGLALAVDAAGNIFVGGESASVDFPTTAGAFQGIYGGGSNDAFAAKLNPMASALLYSTYLGGADPEAAFGIAIDGSGSAYLGGVTYSSDFPTTAGAFQTAFGGGGEDAFVTKLNPNGSALSYSTYVGGSALDFGRDIAIDGSGSAYLAGETFSSDFPTANAFQPSLGGDEDAFVTKLDPTGGALSFSSYLGGSGVDAGFGIALDSSSPPSAYPTGVSESADYPTTAGAFQTTSAGSSDVFVAKVSPAAPSSTTVYYLHGNGSTLTLDGSAPTGTTSKYADSASIAFSGGNPWKAVGIWSAAPATSSRTLLGLSDLHTWLGLKSSDDQGTQFDLRGEVAKNGVPVASSTTRCITGVTRNPDLAKEVTAAFGAVPPVSVAPGDVLSLKLSTRIGTNPDGTKCSGHSNAVGLRVYFDAVSRAARFSATFSP